MTHQVAYASLQGRTHKVNQDAGGAWTWTRPDGIPVSLVVVADGVSAGRHSENASRLVVARIREQMERFASDPGQDTDALALHLGRATSVANEEIAALPHESLFSADATTVVAAVCLGDEVAGGWIGDSRIYSLTQTGPARMSRDHSWAEDAIQHGVLTPDLASRDPRSHMITRWLGPQEGAPPEFEMFRFQLRAPDVILCCSDGLYGYFTPPAGREDELSEALLRSTTPLQQRLNRIAAIAMSRGGHDDITGAALQIVPTSV